MSDVEHSSHPADPSAFDAVSSHGGRPAGEIGNSGLGHMGTAKTAAALETRNLSRAVAGKILVSDVCVQVRPGEVMAVVGPSGAGKSSFLRLLNRLDEPKPALGWRMRDKVASAPWAGAGIDRVEVEMTRQCRTSSQITGVEQSSNAISDNCHHIGRALGD